MTPTRKHGDPADRLRIAATELEKLDPGQGPVGGVAHSLVNILGALMVEMGGGEVHISADNQRFTYRFMEDADILRRNKVQQPVMENLRGPSGP